MDDKVKNSMDESDIALEQALLKVGGGEEGENGEDSSDDGEAGEDNVLNDALGRLDDGRMYQAKGLNPSYHHHSRPNSTTEKAIRSPATTSGVVRSCEKTMCLATIIEDDRTFLMFRRFLKDQCITRNLNFWLACEHYRQLSAGEQATLQNVARAIYFKFIKWSAPQYVTILDQTKRLIKMSLELRGNPITPQLYETAQSEIWEMMERNELHQFLVSEFYADCSLFTTRESQTGDAVYTPGARMAKPSYNVCGGGSLQQTDSEDSTSVTSFPSE